MHFSINGWDNVFFELAIERVKASINPRSTSADSQVITSVDVSAAQQQITSMKVEYRALQGGLSMSSAEFQILEGRYFGRFPCCCRNFDKTSIACCHLVAFLLLFQSHVACWNLPLTGP